MLFSTLFFLVISRYALGVEVKKAVGDEAVFRPTKPLPSPVNSIAWKHTSNNVVVIAIEWDEDGFNTPNDRFKGFTTLDEKTGVMTIKPVDISHSGEYFFEVNSKEQGERFTLTVANRVQKPVITIEPTNKIDVVYLRCEYSETITWKNSAGQTLTGSPITPKGESITVKKNGDPGNFYTCSLRNGVSEEISDRIYEKDLFKDAPDGLSAGAIAGIVIVIIIIIIIFAIIVFLYKRYKTFDNFIQCLPCPKGYRRAASNDKGDAEALKEVSNVPKPNVETEPQAGNATKPNVDALENTSPVTKPNDDTEPQAGNATKPNGDAEALKEVSNVPKPNDDSTPAPDDKSTEGNK